MKNKSGQLEHMTKTLQSVFNTVNPFPDTGIQGDIVELNNVLRQPDVITDAARVLAKIPRLISIPHYSQTNDVCKDTNISQYSIYKINHTFVDENSLKQIAIDAKLSGLLKSANIARMIQTATLETYENPDRPVLVKISNHTYFIAPVVKNY